MSAQKEITITISHGDTELIRLIRESYKITAESADETGVMLKVVGTAKELDKLKFLFGEK